MSALNNRPAWREPMVWLVVGGPASVVVASFFTLALAIKHPDPPLDLRASAQRSADDVEPADMRAHEGDVPALIARNHAATGAAATSAATGTAGAKR